MAKKEKPSKGKVIISLSPFPALTDTFLKKRKRTQVQDSNDAINTSKPTAVFVPSEGRAYTLSIALPGSIIAK